eukprot:SAG11_NODE_17829_length_507_cov_9.485294_1_plen_49_part_01
MRRRRPRVLERSAARGGELRLPPEGRRLWRGAARDVAGAGDGGGAAAGG